MWPPHASAPAEMLERNPSVMSRAERLQMVCAALANKACPECGTTPLRADPQLLVSPLPLGVDLQLRLQVPNQPTIPQVLVTCPKCGLARYCDAGVLGVM